jgi:hypothetical protein
MLDKYDEYIEKLLLAQYDVSELIEHKLERGEIREDFIKHQVERQYRGISCCKGILTDVYGANQSGQIDFIIPKRTARQRQLGDHSIFLSEDVLFVIEVKSNAKGTDFKELNEKAGRYKALEGSRVPMIGMFCYYYDLQMKNLLKRFGYIYDNEIQAFVQQDECELAYPNIDFVIALDCNEELGRNRRFFIIRDENNPTNGYMLFLDSPVSKYFFKLLARSIE